MAGVGRRHRVLGAGVGPAQRARRRVEGEEEPVVVDEGQIVAEPRLGRRRPSPARACGCDRWPNTRSARDGSGRTVDRPHEGRQLRRQVARARGASRARCRARAGTGRASRRRAPPAARARRWRPPRSRGPGQRGARGAVVEQHVLRLAPGRRPRRRARRARRRAPTAASPASAGAPGARVVAPPARPRGLLGCVAPVCDDDEDRVAVERRSRRGAPTREWRAARAPRPSPSSRPTSSPLGVVPLAAVDEHAAADRDAGASPRPAASTQARGGEIVLGEPRTAGAAQDQKRQAAPGVGGRLRARPPRRRTSSALPARWNGLVAQAARPQRQRGGDAISASRRRARLHCDAPRWSSSFCASFFDGRSSFAGTEAMYSTSAVVATAPDRPPIVRTHVDAQLVGNVVPLDVLAERRRRRRRRRRCPYSSAICGTMSGVASAASGPPRRRRPLDAARTAAASPCVSRRAASASAAAARTSGAASPSRSSRIGDTPRVT